MTAPDLPSAALLPHDQPTAQRPRRLRRVLVIVLVAATAAVSGAFAGTAFSQGFGPAGFGPPWLSRPPLFDRPFDPAFAEERADKMVRHLAIEIDATADQQEKLRAIVRSAVQDLVPFREKMMNLRSRGRELLLQSTVDRSAIESVRSEQVALFDQASRRIAQALGDAASVLNADQRRKIADRMDAARSRFGWWHRG
jgi:protein CpxP